MKKIMKLILLAICVYCLPVSAGIVPLADSVGNTGDYSGGAGGYTFTTPYAKDLYIVGTVTFSNFTPTDSWNVVTLFDSNNGEAFAYAQLGNGINWGMVTGGVGEMTSTEPIVDGEPMLIVVKMQQAGKVFKLWLNPDLSQPETVPTMEQVSTRDNFTLGNVAFRGGFWGGNPNASTIDYENFMLFLNESPFNSYSPVTPNPAIGATRVELSTDLSWQAPLIGTSTGYDVYVKDADPNVAVATKVASNITATTLTNAELTAAYGPLLNGTLYEWSVDSHDPNAGYPVLRKGNTWSFTTMPATVIIESGPESVAVAAGSSADFAVVDLNGMNYQWYFTNLDGSVTDLALTESAKYVNVNTGTLTVTDVAVADEGYYYCQVSNSLPSMLVSPSARLWTQGMVAHWSFENNSFESDIAGSPATVVIGDPTFVAGISGSGMDVTDGIDMLHTDAEQASYFDICDEAMTVSCWVKSTNTKTWVAHVARNGEGQGWQLRQSGFTSDRPCFTTRGTGNDDGTPADRTVYDGQWHYLVATFDGAVKKVYIDGVVSRLYSVDDGSFTKDSDVATAPINASASPVAIAGRVSGAAGSLDIQVGNNLPGIYDEVAIYNYALDSITIAQNYANMTGSNVCLGQPYDLNADCVVDLVDFALLAKSWLEDAIVSSTQN